MPSLQRCLFQTDIFIPVFAVSVMYFKQGCGKSYCPALMAFLMESGKCGAVWKWY